MNLRAWALTIFRMSRGDMEAKEVIDMECVLVSSSSIPFSST